MSRRANSEGPHSQRSNGRAQTSHQGVSVIATAGGAIPRSAMSVPEASKALGLSNSTVYALVADGTLRAKRIGRRIIIPVSALHELLDDTSAVREEPV